MSIFLTAKFSYRNRAGRALIWPHNHKISLPVYKRVTCFRPLCTLYTQHFLQCQPQVLKELDCQSGCKQKNCRLSATEWSDCMSEWEDRGRNKLDSETPAVQEVSRNRDCMHVSQGQEEAAKRRGNGKNKDWATGKNPVLTVKPVTICFHCIH